MPVLDYLSLAPVEFENVAAAFRQGVGELGYVEGKNFAIEYRFLNWKPALLPEAASDLLRLNVNAIFATGPTALAAAATPRPASPSSG